MVRSAAVISFTCFAGHSTANATQQARSAMRLLDWVLRRDDRVASDRNRAVSELSESLAFDRNRAVSELSEFLARITEVDGRVLGMAAVQAADVAARLYADTSGEVDLRSPRAALAVQPALLTELTEAVIELQKADRQFEALGPIIWVNTLRAELIPELRPLVKQMWSLIDKGGFPFVVEAAKLYEDKTGRSMQDNILFQAIPEDFDD
jgi:vacuolar-type H+-ATPase subunit D/Vma8